MTGTEEVFEICTISEWGPHLTTQAATIELMTVEVSYSDSFTYTAISFDWFSSVDASIDLRHYP